VSRTLWRTVRLWAVVVLLLFCAYSGIVGGLDALRSVSTPGQRIAGASQLVYGISAVAALLALLLRRRWSMPLLLVWGAALTLTGGMAPVVWGEQNALVGLLGAAVVAPIVGLVLWACRSHNRGTVSSPPPRSGAET
jgi:hypothetical protein